MVLMRPIDLKEVAKRFTEKYYPQWLLRFDRIWEMFEKTDPNKIVSDPTKSQYQQGNALGIARTAEPESKEYMSGIAIVAFTYQGAKDKDFISGDEIKKRISLIPNLKITPGVQQKLENVLSEMLPLMAKNTEEQAESKTDDNNIQAISGEPRQIDILEIDKSYFAEKYQIDFYSGIKGQSGKLVFDKTNTINLSGIENGICITLYNGLKKTWSNMPAKDIGWVSHNDFRELVFIWKEKIKVQKDKYNPDVVVSDLTITNAINRINKKLRDKLGLDDSHDLIENGRAFLWGKHYRFRINYGHIDLKD